MLFRSLSIFLASTFTACGLFADSYQEDAKRADGLWQRFGGKVLNERLEPHWLAGSTHLWYRRQLAGGGHETVLVDTESGARTPAFDHAKLAATLKLDALRLDVQAMEFGESPDTLRINIGNKGYTLDRKTEAVTEGAVLEMPKPQKGQRRGVFQNFPPPRPKSPDDRNEVFIRDHNLFIKSTDDGAETQLTTDGVQGNAYQNGGWWSADSKRFVILQVRDAQQHPVHMVESSPKDQVQPKLFTHDYLKPGDQIAHQRVHLFDAEAKKEIPVDDGLFPNPWSLQHLHWSLDNQTFRFVYNERGHQIMRVIGIAGETGATTAIVDEKSATFIDYSQKQFVHFLRDTDEILWSSERDGWHHLYLYDAKTGALKNQITSGKWIVRSVEEIDRKARTITFQAMGIFPDQDPYHMHYARIGFDRSDPVRLTEGDGTHSLNYSPDRRFYVDTFSRVDLPPVHELRRASDGQRVCDLEKADTSELTAAGWRAPERFVAKGRDGETDIHGIIIRPTNFDPTQKYPVIEKIYAGPHGQFVPKSFSNFHGAMRQAEFGFILVQIDGMGTNFRSKAFHDVCWKNLKDSGFPDRILWIEAAAALHPEVDLDRVGIFGGSAGGQSTLAGLLFHPEFYKAGVADCGCHDNRMDKIWWNEAWMGWPIGDHYADNSNVTHAGKLQGKLMLTLGEMDQNVDPASTMQVVDALIKADKDFDFIIVPGAGHGIGESPYMDRRRTQFFIEHLK